MKPGLGLLLGSMFAAAHAESVPWTSERWQIVADSNEVVEFAGKSALYLNGGNAVLDGVSAERGVLRVMIAFGPERGFSGAMFRYQRPGDFENFYLRPHQSGQPDASQYTPDVNGVSAWQLFHGPAYAAPFEFKYRQWMQLEIVFDDRRAKITLDGETLWVHHLRRPLAAGTVGLRSGFAPAWYADFSFSDVVPTGAFDGMPAAPETAPAPGVVTEWRVSSAFAEDRLDAAASLQELTDGLTFQTMTAQPEGFVNLAHAADVSAQRRLVLASFTLASAEPATRWLDFGYSDRVRVYLNGTQLYRGDNTYRTRDYRYLGTIGLFDSVPLALESGSNTITFAVAEAFGGWGVMARLRP